MATVPYINIFAFSFHIFSHAFRNRKQSTIAPIPSKNIPTSQLAILISGSLQEGRGQGFDLSLIDENIGFKP
jgi:hypothetical protein